MHETYEIRQSAVERGEWEVWRKPTQMLYPKDGYLISRHESKQEAQEECDRMNHVTNIPMSTMIKGTGGNHNEQL